MDQVSYASSVILLVSMVVSGVYAYIDYELQGPEEMTVDKHNVNVVVIDDEPVTLELIQHILEDFISGKIFSFSSSIDALTFIKMQSVGMIDLVICDWNMPAKNGVDWLKAFRAFDKRTPFLMLTANATRDLVMNAKKSGATDFMAKPFSSGDLVLKASKLLDIDLDVNLESEE